MANTEDLFAELDSLPDDPSNPPAAFVMPEAPAPSPSPEPSLEGFVPEPNSNPLYQVLESGANTIGRGAAAGFDLAINSVSDTVRVGTTVAEILARAGVKDFDAIRSGDPETILRSIPPANLIQSAREVVGDENLPEFTLSLAASGYPAGRTLGGALKQAALSLAGGFLGRRIEEERDPGSHPLSQEPARLKKDLLTLGATAGLIKGTGKVREFISPRAKGISINEEALAASNAAVREAEINRFIADQFTLADNNLTTLVLKDRLTKGAQVVRDKGILEQVSTSKAKNVREGLGPVNAQFKQKLDDAASQALKDRDAVVLAADNAANEHNLNILNKNSYLTKPVGLTSADEVATLIKAQLDPLIEKAKLAGQTEKAAALSDVLDAQLSGVGRQSNYSLNDLKNKISESYEALRQAHAFDDKALMGGIGTDVNPVKNLALAEAHSELANLYRDVIATKIDDINSAIGGKLKIPSNIKGSSPGDVFRRAGQDYNGLKPYQDAYELMNTKVGGANSLSNPASAVDRLSLRQQLIPGASEAARMEAGARVFPEAVGRSQALLDAARGRPSTSSLVLQALQGPLPQAAGVVPDENINIGADIGRGARAVGDFLSPPEASAEPLPATLPTPTPSPINSAISSALSDIAPRPVVAPRKSITGYDSEEDAGDGKVILNKESDRADLRDTVFLSNMPNDKKRGVIKALIKGDPIDPNDLDEVATGRPRQVKRRVRSNVMRDLVRNRDARKLAEHGQISKAVERRKESDY